MESDSEIVLETEEVPVIEVDDSAPEGDSSLRPLPFSFSKRHGVLIREIRRRQGRRRISQRRLSLKPRRSQALCRRSITADKSVTAEAFDALLQQTYEQGSQMAMQMVGGLDEDIDLLQVAQELPEPSDLLESDDDAPIIRFINAVLTQAIKENASDVHVEPLRKPAGRAFPG